MTIVSNNFSLLHQLSVFFFGSWLQKTLHLDPSSQAPFFLKVKLALKFISITMKFPQSIMCLNVCLLQSIHRVIFSFAFMWFSWTCCKANCFSLSTSVWSSSNLSSYSVQLALVLLLVKELLSSWDFFLKLYYSLKTKLLPPSRG